MAKFDAGQAVERLEFDFTAFGGRSGVIPEPSTGQVQKFFRVIKDVAREIRDLENRAKQIDKRADESDVTDDEAIDSLANMADEASERYQDQLVHALADLCSSEPNADEIGALPFRVLNAFSAWVAEQVRPQQPAATKN